MVKPTHNAETPQTGWLPPLFALWSLCWRLSILLLFLLGAGGSVLFGRWWFALGFVMGFVIAAAVIRQMSPVEQQDTSSDDPIVFL
jgi:hypothetical protein